MSTFTRMRPHLTSLRLALVACAALACGCDEPAPMTPTPSRLPIEGTWAGTMTDRSAGRGAFEVVLIGSDDVGTGTFTLAFPDPSANLQGLVLARTKDAPVIDLSINVTTVGRDCPGAPGVFYSARLTVSGSRMSGTYEPAIACPLL